MNRPYHHPNAEDQEVMVSLVKEDICPALMRRVPAKAQVVSVLNRINTSR